MPYLIPRAVFAPVALSVVAIAASVVVSWWLLASIPFIWLGSVCAAPNFNLADGCLSYAAVIFGVIVGIFFEPLGVAIVFGTLCGYFLSAAEKYLRMRKTTDEKDDS